MITAFVVNVILILACFFTGAVAYSVISFPAKKQLSEINIFVSKLIIGLLVIVTSYSLVVTKFVSINLLLVVVAILFGISCKIKFSFFNVKHFIQGYKYIGVAVVIIIISTFLVAIIFNSFSTDKVATSISTDHVYYAFTGIKMDELGVEGIDFGLKASANFAKEYRNSYHYFDLWMLAIMNKIVNGKMGMLKIYSFIFTPFVLTCCYLSIISVFKLFKSSITILDAFMLFCITCYLGPFGNNFLTGLNLVQLPKLYCAVIFSCIACWFFCKNEFEKGFLVLMCIAIMNVLALPVVCFSAFLFAFYLFYKKDTSNAVKVLLNTFIIGGLFYLFYLLLGNTSGKLYQPDFILSSYLKNSFFYVVKRLVRLSIIIIPILLAFYTLKKYANVKLEPYKNLLPITIILLVASDIISVALVNVADAGQIGNFPSNMFITIWLVIVVAFLSTHSSKKPMFYPPRVVYVLFLFLLSGVFVAIIFKNYKRANYNSVSSAFIKNVEAYIKDGDTYGYLYDGEKFSSSKSYSNPNLILDKLNFLEVLPLRLNKVCLNAYINQDSIPLKYLDIQKLITKGDLYQYANKNGYSKAPLNQVQRDFVLANNIKHVIADNENALPNTLSDLVSVKLKDSLSNVCFYVLK